MNILLTNDDGIHSGGINELAKILLKNGELFVVAPLTEQSGVSQSITFRRPLFPRPLPGGSRTDAFEFKGYSLDGTPADCIRLAMFELCPWKPDLVVSGINGGLNAGVNVVYSGTVGAALTAATYGIPAIAISLEYGINMDFATAAEIVWPLIERFGALAIPKTVININLPSAALHGNAEVAIVPVETNLLGTSFEEGADPKGHSYYWASIKPDPEPSPFETDCQALAAGKISVSPITFDLNHLSALPLLESALQRASL